MDGETKGLGARSVCSFAPVVQRSVHVNLQACTGSIEHP